MIALSTNYDKRMKTLDRVTSYPYHAEPGILCKEEFMKHPNIKY